MLVAAACCLLWLGGLLWFATPPAADTRAAATDAIIVLTGGRLRLQSGMDLLREGKGRKLFVSGVNQQVDLDELLRRFRPCSGLGACCIVLGHDADNTFGNALETAQWMRQQGFTACVWSLPGTTCRAACSNSTAQCRRSKSLRIRSFPTRSSKSVGGLGAAPLRCWSVNMANTWARCPAR